MQIENYLSTLIIGCVLQLGVGQSSACVGDLDVRWEAFPDGLREIVL